MSQEYHRYSQQLEDIIGYRQYLQAQILRKQQDLLALTDGQLEICDNLKRRFKLYNLPYDKLIEALDRREYSMLQYFNRIDDGTEIFNKLDFYHRIEAYNALRNIQYAYYGVFFVIAKENLLKNIEDQENQTAKIQYLQKEIFEKDQQISSLNKEIEVMGRYSQINKSATEYEEGSELPEKSVANSDARISMSYEIVQTVKYENSSLKEQLRLYQNTIQYLMNNSYISDYLPKIVDTYTAPTTMDVSYKQLSDNEPVAGMQESYSESNNAYPHCAAQSTSAIFSLAESITSFMQREYKQYTIDIVNTVFDNLSEIYGPDYQDVEKYKIAKNQEDEQYAFGPAGPTHSSSDRSEKRPEEY